MPQKENEVKDHSFLEGTNFIQFKCKIKNSFGIFLSAVQDKYPISSSLYRIETSPIDLKVDGKKIEVQKFKYSKRLLRTVFTMEKFEYDLLNQCLVYQEKSIKEKDQSHFEKSIYQAHDKIKEILYEKKIFNPGKFTYLYKKMHDIGTDKLIESMEKIEEFGDQFKSIINFQLTF